MADIDTVLSESFKRIAEPGDSTGVADLIRERVAAGDAGTPSSGGEFGGGASGGGWPWLPWVGGALTVAIVGAVVGATGVFGSLAPASSAPGDSGASGASAPSLSVAQLTSGLDCPGGSPVVGFYPGDRVLAVARSDDSSYLAVRSPFDRADTVWLPVSVFDVDEGQSTVASLPVDGCFTPVVTLLPPVVEPEPEPAPPAPQPPAPQQPPASDNKPSLGTPSSSRQSINTSGAGQSSTITVTAADDHGVTNVLINWSGADTGSQQMTKSGSSWTFVYHPSQSINGDVTFTMRALDTANQQSQSKSITVNVFYFG